MTAKGQIRPLLRAIIACFPVYRTYVTARGVSDTRTATLASGADLPYGVSFSLSHALTRTTRLQRVGEGFAAMAGRVVEACHDLGSAGRSISG